MEKLIDISSYPVVNVLDLLLEDKSTKKISSGLQILMKNLVTDSRTRSR